MTKIRIDYFKIQINNKKMRILGGGGYYIHQYHTAILSQKHYLAQVLCFQLQFQSYKLGQKQGFLNQPLHGSPML